MVIQHNIAAINSHRNLGINNAQTNKNLEKLSSGFRINRAGDDAAGLAISEKMRGQIRGLAMAEQNTSNGISLIQTAEGGLNETHAILQRMRELAVQASNGTYQDEDRDQIQLEVQALKSEIDRIASATHYNGIKLLDGSLSTNCTAAVEKTLADMDYKTPAGTIVAITAASTGGSPVAIAAGSDFVIDYKRDATGTMVGSGTITIGGVDYEIGNMVLGTDKITFDIIGTKDTGANDAKMEIEFDTGKFPTDGFRIEGKTSTLTTVVAADITAHSLYEQGENLVFQIGANGTADQQVSMGVENMSSSFLGTKNAAGTFIVAGSSVNDIDVTTRAGANAAIKIVDDATNQVSSQRAELGALQNRLEHTLNNLGVTKENLTAAESTIRDVDMAKEMMEFTKNSILVQASQAMLAQANSLPQGVLSLLR